MPFTKDERIEIIHVGTPCRVSCVYLSINALVPGRPQSLLKNMPYRQHHEDQGVNKTSLGQFWKSITQGLSIRNIPNIEHPVELH